MYTSIHVFRYTVKPPIKRPPPISPQGWPNTIVHKKHKLQYHHHHQSSLRHRTHKALNFKTYNFSKAVNPKKLAAAKTPTTSASLTFISYSFSYKAERARAKAEK